MEYTREQLWDMYLEIGRSERHFNTVQEKYRLISSSWLLATVVAVSYVIVNQDKLASVPAPAEIIVSSLAYFGSIGISLLWVLDVRVYQVLLSSCYAEGLALERGQPWLPPIRRRIRSNFKGKLPGLISIYYVGSTSFLFVLGTAALATFVYQNWSKADLIQLKTVLACILATIDVVVIASVYFASRQKDLTLEVDATDFSENTRAVHYSEVVIVAPIEPEKRIPANEAT